MLFDEAGGTTHELQAVVGDSGGGCFAKRGSTWELVGVMFAILVFRISRRAPRCTATRRSPTALTPRARAGYLRPSSTRR
jgi:hypothetical protein